MKTKFSSSLRRLGCCFSSRALSLATAMVAAALLPAVAIASTTPILPGPVYDLTLTQHGVVHQFTDPGTYILGGQSVTATGFGLSGPSLTGHVDAAADTCCFNFPHSSILYHYEVVGPLDNVLVPLWVTYAMHASATRANPSVASSSASATLEISGGVHKLVSANSVGTLGVDGIDPHPENAVMSGSFTDSSGTASFNQLSGSVGDVLLRVAFIATGLGVADASVDPFIFIDPVFLSSNQGYSVIVSAGIGNAPPPVAGVPEPETYALMLAGLGLLGFTARRRKQHAA